MGRLRESIAETGFRLRDAGAEAAGMVVGAVIGGITGGVLVGVIGGLVGFAVAWMVRVGHAYLYAPLREASAVLAERDELRKRLDAAIVRPKRPSFYVVSQTEPPDPTDNESWPIYLLVDNWGHLDRFSARVDSILTKHCNSWPPSYFSLPWVDGEGEIREIEPGGRRLLSVGELLGRNAPQFMQNGTGGTVLPFRFSGVTRRGIIEAFSDWPKDGQTSIRLEVSVVVTALNRNEAVSCVLRIEERTDNATGIRETLIGSKSSNPVIGTVDFDPTIKGRLLFTPHPDVPANPPD